MIIINISKKLIYYESININIDFYFPKNIFSQNYQIILLKANMHRKKKIFTAFFDDWRISFIYIYL
jgi:hypothetical protein